jgi:hypothetical protein
MLNNRYLNGSKFYLINEYTIKKTFTFAAFIIIKSGKKEV